MADLTGREVQALIDRFNCLRPGPHPILDDLPRKPNGAFDPAGWDMLNVDERERLQARLESYRCVLEADEPTDNNSIMFNKHAPNFSVWALTIWALAASAGVLWLIQARWPAAVGRVPSVTQGPRVAGLRVTDTTVARSITDSATGTDSTTLPAGDALQCDEDRFAPTEGAVLVMIILLGTLGGLVHLSSSLAMFVGNRRLKKSWIVYYLLIPVEGAALAPILYLLLRVGVLSPNVGQAAGTCSLNVLGLYGFAGLTGLFAKQGIEMLADVFSTIFKKVKGKDAVTNGGVKPGA